MKKFRFQLLHKWIVENFLPCRICDIGGGKGLLSFLLHNAGFDATVIDPCDQILPDKYKDLYNVKHKIPDTFKIKRLTKEYAIDMAKDYDLLIGLHAHGSNMKILEGAAKYKKDFILLPCCVIDEPIEIKPDIDWLKSLEEYAITLGHKTTRFELNFRGQNIGFYKTDGTFLAKKSR
ncbi:hypothetical protein JXL83_04910 [candidate division WOR-3 bacterium]|nr:hypothetical protein [candidate division WOR-3 bacterium]